jgi:beta-glucosidase
LVDGIILAYLPGNEGGRAISDALYGHVNPSGKLPITYPRHSGSLWTYDHTKADERDGGFGFEGFKPQYEFGYGLSYTSFEYADIKIEKDTVNITDSIRVSVNVTNNGKRDGKEVVQLYSSDLVASIVPSVKQLRRFRKIKLASYESRDILFSIHPNELSFVDQNNKWIVEEGDFLLKIGDLSTKFYLKK